MVEVFVNGRKVVGERSGKVVGCYDGYLGQEFALAQLELLFSNQLALITDMIDASNIKLNAELQEVNARINIAYTYYNVRYAAGNI